MQHVIVRHAPFFVETYGSLSVWSCQGMENSHHAAKAAYQRHTQHSGGKTKKSALLQTFEHWFRIIQHRFRNKDILHSEDDQATHAEDQNVVLQARRARVFASTASAHWAEWRSRCTRQGSRWVPNPVEPNISTETIATPVDLH